MSQLNSVRLIVGTATQQTAFIMRKASLWACGMNHQGQLGDGGTVKSNAQIRLQALAK